MAAEVWEATEKIGMSLSRLAKRKPRALDRCEAVDSQKGLWWSREEPFHVLLDGLLPETIKGSKGVYKTKGGRV